MTNSTRIARARALMRHAMLHMLPEALVGHEAEQVLPDVRATSQFAVARGLSEAAQGAHVEQLIAAARDEVQAATVAISENRGEDPARTLGGALDRLQLLPDQELAAELVLVCHLDPVTRQSARLMAQLLHRGPAVGVGLFDDALNLGGFGPDRISQMAADSGPLGRLGVLELHELIGGDPASRMVVPSARLLSFLNGSDDPGPLLQPHLTQTAWRDEEHAALAETLADLIDAVAGHLGNGRPVMLRGAANAGGRTVAAAASARLGRPWFGVDATALWQERGVLPAAICHSRLTGAVLFASGAEDVPEAWNQGRDNLLRLTNDLAALASPAILRFRGRVPPLFGEAVGRALGGVEIALPPLDLGQRETLFARCLEGIEGADKLSKLGAGFALGAESIAVACSYARYRAAGDNGSGDRKASVVSALALREACATTVTRRLREYATRVQAVSGWDDLVLTTEKLEQVKDIVRYAQHRARIFDSWGFARKMSYGRTLSCLFSGPSGTGKTMVAGLVAKELGVELFRVDLSSVVSKYIGETEERLDALFTEAGQTGVALLFDEADALFSQRTSVQSSNDRYANLEVNFLLQRLEDFDGVVFLTTNFGTSIDEAFMRRLRFKVEFEEPGADERVRLWQVMLPEEMPVADDLDLEWIGDNYVLNGGHIRNAILRAALLAADADTPLTMALALDAINAEYRELGKLAPVYTAEEDW